ncbi:LysR family transcriptional regulator [Roseovarius aestuarii]|nr:LysR family transcriptional regulator [Roseovarius aestuarii]
MKLQQLEAFVWITRLGSFAAAAERLNITQPTVSQRISELEGQLGVAVFKRVGRRAHLTEQGRGLMPLAEEMMSLRQNILHKVANPTHISGTVRLGVAELVSLTWLPQLIDRVSRLYPGVTLELDIDLTENLWDKLHQGVLDTALLPKIIERPSFETIFLGDTHFAWMGSPSLNVPDRQLEPAEVAQWPVLLLSQHSNLYSIIENWFQDGGARMQRRALCNNLYSIANLTICGLGVSTLPTDLYQGEIERNELTVLQTDPPLPAVGYWAAYRPAESTNLAAIVARLAAECTTFSMADPTQ